MVPEYMTRDLIRSAALDYLFSPYRWGGENTLGIHPVMRGESKVWALWEDTHAVQPGHDCSGFAQAPYRAVLGYTGDRTAAGLYDYLEATSAPLVGDLGFYGKTRPTHVVMCLEPGGGAIIGANGGGSPRLGETLEEYAERMATRHAMVRIEDSRHGGWRYRYNGKDFLGWRRAPI